MAPEDNKNWINEAECDLDSAEILKEKERHNLLTFYAQQTVKKLLKAVLMFKNGALWGHLAKHLLIKLNEIIEVDFSHLIHNSIELDHHYILSRYPNFHHNSAPQ